MSKGDVASRDAQRGSHHRGTLERLNPTEGHSVKELSCNPHQCQGYENKESLGNSSVQKEDQET